jgi:hypothetical protein
VRERRVEGTSCLSLRRSAQARGFKKMAPGFANLSSEAQKFGHPVVGLRIPNWIAHGGISLIVPPHLPTLPPPIATPPQPPSRPAPQLPLGRGSWANAWRSRSQMAYDPSGWRWALRRWSLT